MSLDGFHSKSKPTNISSKNITLIDETPTQMPVRYFKTGFVKFMKNEFLSILAGANSKAMSSVKRPQSTETVAKSNKSDPKSLKAKAYRKKDQTNLDSAQVPVNFDAKEKQKTTQLEIEEMSLEYLLGESLNHFLVSVFNDPLLNTTLNENSVRINSPQQPPSLEPTIQPITELELDPRLGRKEYHRQHRRQYRENEQVQLCKLEQTVRQWKSDFENLLKDCWALATENEAYKNEILNLYKEVPMLKDLVEKDPDNPVFYVKPTLR